MSASPHIPLFHKITATEHALGDLDDEWSRQAKELLLKLRAWLNACRCVLIFTVDDSFHHEVYSGKIACSFFIRGHEVLVLEREGITLDLLSAAYHSEPQYYLKTDAPVETVQSLLEGCLKDESENIWRGEDFDELALHKKFGDFIMVFYGWSEHYMVGERDIIAHDHAVKARQEAERAKPLWRKVLGGMYVALLILGCLTFVLPAFYLVRRGGSGALESGGYDILKKRPPGGRFRERSP